MNETMSEHRNRAADLGLHQTSTGSCPRRLVRLRHGDGCWCLTRLNDHGRRYQTTSGRPVILWEPYSAPGEELADVLAAAAADGLQVTVTGVSPWYPGATFALSFEAAS